MNRKRKPVVYVFGEQQKREQILSWLKEAKIGYNDHEDVFKGFDPNLKDYRYDQEQTLDIVELTLSEIEQFCTICIAVLHTPSYKNSLTVRACWDLDIPIIAYSEKEIDDPWAIYYCNEIVTNKEELLECIKSLVSKKPLT